jgi:hypothetical protein
MKERVARAIIGALLDKWLDELKHDTHRSLRRLVELGAFFSNGNIQKQFFNMVQKLLEHNTCGYYDIIRGLVCDVNRHALKRFSMNIGYNALICSAALRRKNGASWAQVIDDQQDLDESVRNGKPLGTLVYFVLNADMADEALLKTADANTDCAFFLLCSAPPRALPHLTNIMTLVSFREDYFTQHAAALRDARCLWGAYCRYEKDTAIAMPVFGAPDCRVCLFVPGDGASLQTRHKMSEYICAIRKNGETSVFPVELYSDIAYMDALTAQEDPHIFAQSPILHA